MRFWTVFCCFVFFLVGTVACTQNPDPAGTDGGTKDSTPAPSSGELTFLTYNVHGLPPEITKDDTLGRLEMIGPLLLKGFDIIGLQEQFMEEGYKKLKPSLKYKTELWFKKLKDDRVMGSGLMVLSNLGYTAYKTQLYKSCNGVLDGASDCLASKGFQMVRFTLAEGVEVDVYNSHLEAGGGAKDDKVRVEHVQELQKAMNEWSKGRAIIFLGDSNLKQTRPSDKKVLAEWLKEQGLSDSCDVVKCASPGRIDKILFRGSDKLELKVLKWWIPEGFVDKKGVDLSDHKPIAARMQWKRK